MSPQVRLANEIALQFPRRREDEAAAEIAKHLSDFWDPRMRADLLQWAEAEPEALDPLVRAAVRLL